MSVESNASPTDWIAMTISLAALTLSFISFVYVRTQTNSYIAQLKLEAWLAIAGINRELITLGFSDPEFFQILDGQQIKNTNKQQRYLQLWLNQINSILQARNLGMITDENWHGLKKDIQVFIQEGLLYEHWNQTKPFYSPDLSEFIKNMSPKQNDVT